MYTLATFSRPKENKHLTAAKNAFGSSVAWGGTSTLPSLLLKHKDSKFQRNVAIGAMGVGAANSLRKSYLSSPKPKKPRIKRISTPRKTTIKRNY